MAQSGQSRLWLFLAALDYGAQPRRILTAGAVVLRKLTVKEKEEFMRIDATASHESAGSANSIGVSESAKLQIGAQASEASVLPGPKFLDSAFLDSARRKKSQ